MDTLETWLAEHRLEEYTETFEQNDVRHSDLRHITDEDARELGLPLGARRRLLTALAELRGPPDDALAAANADSSFRSPVASEAAERRQLTVMFCDLVGSTELAHEMDPEDLRELTRAYQVAATQAIEDVGGYVARYMGDGVLAYFGYPVAREDDAERAVRSGLLLTELIPATREDVTLMVRIGIGTGEVVVGDLIGEGTSQERAVVGTTPNLAARLQSAAPPGGVLVSDLTRRLVGDRFTWRARELRGLKGFPDLVRAWELEGDAQTPTRFQAGRPGRTVTFVGRRAELELLSERWDDAFAGDGQLVEVVGSPGIGKSRLCEEVLQRLQPAPADVRRFQCSPLHMNSRLFPLIAEIAHRLGPASTGAWPEVLERSIDPEAPFRDELLQLLGRELAGWEMPEEIQPANRQEREIVAFADELLGMDLDPRILFFEDVHWADATTLDVLRRVVREAPKRRLLVITTSRPDTELPWQGPDHRTTLSLRRLSDRHGGDIVAIVFHDRAIGEDLVARIVSRCDGIPLFVEECARSVHESLLPGSDADVAGTRIPETLHDSLAARLDRLGDARPVARAAAVLGREFDTTLLGRLLDIEESDLSSALGALEGADLIEPRHGPGARYRFKHALIRDAAYEGLLHRERRRLHSLAGDAMLGLDVAAPAQAAHHLHEAQRFDEAAEQWFAAGERAHLDDADIENLAAYFAT